MVLDNNKGRKKYSDVKDYEVLDDIAHIQRLPGNYIGSTDFLGWHHLAREVIDNSADEALVGNCNQIEVFLSDDQKMITVKDNGNGVALGIQPDTGKSVLVTLCAYLKSGGKFSERIYKTSGGLHGIGLTAVNALSSELKIWNVREGKTQFVYFSCGKLMDEQIIETPEAKSGFSVSFTPNPSIFTDFTHFRVDIISERLRELSYLVPNLTISFFSSPQKEPEIYQNQKGLVGLISDLSGGIVLLGTEICFGEWSRNEPYFSLSYAWQYSDEKNKRYQVKSYCNNIYTPDGGTHVEGFEGGYVLTIRDFIKNKFPQLKFSVSKEDILSSLILAISVRISDPQFFGQTKRSLTNKYVRETLKPLFYDLTKKFLQDHASVTESILDKIITSAQNRIKTEEYQSSLRDSVRGVVLPGKLTPCVSKNVDETFLFLVEGDSAGGNSKLARNPYTQAILPLKGKTINVEKKENKKVFENDEVKNIANSLGITIGETVKSNYNFFCEQLDEKNRTSFEPLLEDFVYLDENGNKQTISANTVLNREQVEFIVSHSKNELLKKIRYGKVVVMTDSDFDGDHIGVLQFTLFWSFFRYLIEDGRLYLASPPLYRWQTKKNVVYFYDDNELKEYQKTHKLVGGHLQRFKGLGEMDAIHLRDTTMNPEKGRIFRVALTDVPETYRLVRECMAMDSKYRCQYLESGQHKDASLSVVDSQVELHQAILVKFLNYAYEVVESRALPREDGLKPVQRRIIYTMHELGLNVNSAPRKSSKIVGDVMGKYHPHGDLAIYQAMVKMAQDFNYRYPLIRGFGNWGSQDGDNAAHMRYTEARLTSFGEFLLDDLKYNTVAWAENYDSTCEEPYILPPNLNLLANGSSGIAVGMSTDIPPHNLTELIEAVIAIIQQPDLTVDELIEKINIAPDFPTGGELLNVKQINTIYKEGRGTLYVRSRFEIISSSVEKKPDTIRIFEIPYKIPKSKIIEKIGEIIKDKKIEGLKNVEDYSSLEDKVNVHIRFDPNYDPHIILNQLYKQTELQSTIRVQIRVLINDKPVLLPFINLLRNFIESRLKHIKKKAIFLLNENKKELESLEIKCFIIDNYRQIADTIRGSLSEKEAKEKLSQIFVLSENKIDRILDMSYNFRQFTPERKTKLEKEIERVKEENDRHSFLIENGEERKNYLLKELKELQEKYKDDARRTILVDKPHFISEKELIPSEERVVFLSSIKGKTKTHNYLTVNSLSYIEPTNIPSQGKLARVRGDPWSVMKLNRRDDLWLITNYGKIFLLNFYKIMGLNKTINLDEEYFIREKEGQMLPFLRPLESFVFSVVVKEDLTQDLFLLLVTKAGKIKVVQLSMLLGKIGKSGKRLFAQKRSITRCIKHEKLLVQHGSNTHGCGFRCLEYRLLQKKVLSCLDCKVIFHEDDDPVVQSSVIRGEDFVDAVIKRRLANGNIKNNRVSLCRFVRNKISAVINQKDELVPHYCSLHQELVVEHISFHRNKKDSCHIGCSSQLKIRKQTKDCSVCQKSNFFIKKWKRVVNCDQVVSLLVYNELVNDEKVLISLKEDGSMEKKPFIQKRKFLGLDVKFKKTNYCKKHWFEISELEKIKNKTVSDSNEEKNSLEQRIINSPIPIKEKEDMVKKMSFLSNREFLKKVSNSSFDPLMSQKATEEQIRDLIQISRIYQKSLQGIDIIKNKIDKLKEKIQVCSNCWKYCINHNDLFHTEDCLHCNKFSSDISSLEKDIDQIKSQIDKAKEEKEILSLERKLLSKKKQQKQFRSSSFSLRVSCPKINKIRETRRDCIDCQKQPQKKYLANLNNPLRDVFLVDKTSVKPEIFLLTNDGSVSLYNKKDLVSFLSGESRSRTILKDKTKSIIYMNFIS